MKNLKKSVFFILLMTLIYCCQNINAQTESEPIILGEKISLESKILNETRNIWVYLPEGAKDKLSKKKYPVLFLLDGPTHFYSVSGMIKQLSTANDNMIVPEMIIVGIQNTDRLRDFTLTHSDISYMGDSVNWISGGSNKFFDFIEYELISYLDSNYSTNSYRTFIGHSLGGLCIIDALINRTQLFNNYVAIEPSLWWDNQTLVIRADTALKAKRFKGKALYVGVANTLSEWKDISTIRNDTSKISTHIRSILHFVDSAETRTDNGLLFKWKFYNNDDHCSVPLIAEYDALRFFFSWYPIKGVDDFFDRSLSKTSEELINLINSHYKNISDHYGYNVLPPEDYINSLAYGFMYNKIFEKAYALYNLNIQNYPQSPNVYNSMGGYYLSQSDTLNSNKYYQKAEEISNSLEE